MFLLASVCEGNKIRLFLEQVSPLLEIGTMGLKWRGLETSLRFGY